MQHIEPCANQQMICFNLVTLHDWQLSRVAKSPFSQEAVTEATVSRANENDSLFNPS
jgi:hypothetical protein